MVNLPFEISFITRVRDLTEDEQKVVDHYAEQIVRRRPKELTSESVRLYNSAINEFIAWAESRQFVYPSDIYPRRYTPQEHECIMYKLTRGRSLISGFFFSFSDLPSPESVVDSVLKVARGNVPDYILDLERKLAVEDIKNLIAKGKYPKG